MKNWPEFDSNGDLPTGVHQATLAEVVERFGRATAQRSIVAKRLSRIYELASSSGNLARLIIFGSFITAEPHPNDVDVFLLMEDAFDQDKCSGELAELFEHLETENKGGASVFWMRRVSTMGDEQGFIECWQIKRGQSRRGIVEVTGP